MSLVYRIKQFMLIGGDIVTFAFGFYLGLIIRYWHLPTIGQIASLSAPFFLLFLLWIVINQINSLYELAQLKNKETNKYFIESALICFFVSIIILYFFPIKNASPKSILILNIIIGFGLSYLWRQFYNKYVNSKAFIAKVIFVGFNNEVKELINIFERHPERGYKTVALIEPENKIKSMEYPLFDIYHDLKTLRPAITNHCADIVVIAEHLKEENEALRELYELLFWKVRITDAVSFYEIITGRVPPAAFSENWFLEHLQNRRPVYDKIRVGIDYIIGIIMAVFFAIIFPFVAIAIKTTAPGSIFFKQKRIGKFGDIFYIYKFRSMFVLNKDGSAEIGGAQFAQKNDERITKFGKFLRLTRLDELPQFINLLRGEISFIGPRPERPEIVDQLKAQIPYYPLRHLIKPGITGWAAVHQNYTDTLESSLQKLQYDLFYIKNRSFLLDLSIIFRTINVVMRMKGQ